MFYLTTHSTHFIYGYMASDIWLRTILIVREETRCRHIGYSYRLTARVLLYAPSHRQDNTYHGLCYTSRGALAGTRNSSMGPPHEGSIRRPTAPSPLTSITDAYRVEYTLYPITKHPCLTKPDIVKKKRKKGNDVMSTFFVKKSLNMLTKRKFWLKPYRDCVKHTSLKVRYNR